LLTSTNQKWVILDPIEVKSSHGATLKELPDHSVLSTGMRPEKDTYTITLGTDLTKLTGLKLEVLSDDGLPMKGPGRQDNGNLHLSEVRVRIGSTNVKLQNPVADFDQDGWAIPRAIDGNLTTAWGIYPAIGQPHQAVFEFADEHKVMNGVNLTVELDQLHGGGHLIGRFRLSVTSSPRPLSLNAKPISAELQSILTSNNRTDAQRAELARLALENHVERELASLPVQRKVYCASNVFANDGSFRPSPIPRKVSLLKRGEVTKPIRLVEPGTMSAVPGLPSRFTGLDATRESERRIALARWLTDAKNPLTWRSIANRVFHYHIGKGIVDTPNDLGKMGGKPSHPELLDWLATEIRETQSLKYLHRLILTSRTYRQSCRHDPKAAAIDGDNRLLWRMNRGRLDAESVRDAVLQSSGQLDLTMYGVPVQHFLMKPGIHVTPLINYETFDVDSMESRRRSVYRFIFRTRPDPFLEVLDCPDASQSAPVRSNSVSPLQALALWNDKFLTRYSEHLASVVTSANAELPEQVRMACERVLLRSPNDAEQGAFVEYAKKHGLPNLCRVLFNSSEFLFVD